MRGEWQTLLLRVVSAHSHQSHHQLFDKPQTALEHMRSSHRLHRNHHSSNDHIQLKTAQHLHKGYEQRWLMSFLAYGKGNLE
jgi:hypothetical protein